MAKQNCRAARLPVGRSYKGIGEFYAGLTTNLTDAGSPDDAEVDSCSQRRTGAARLEREQDEDDVWEAVALDEDGEDAEPMRHKRVKKGTPGAIEKTNVRGHKYYVDKETVKTTPAQRKTARDEVTQDSVRSTSDQTGRNVRQRPSTVPIPCCRQSGSSVVKLLGASLCDTTASILCTEWRNSPSRWRRRWRSSRRIRRCRRSSSRRFRSR